MTETRQREHLRPEGCHPTYWKREIARDVSSQPFVAETPRSLSIRSALHPPFEFLKPPWPNIPLCAPSSRGSGRSVDQARSRYYCRRVRELLQHPVVEHREFDQD